MSLTEVAEGEPPVAGPVGAPVQEVRLALVLTGGVSLAVWMGGVVAEIQRLTEASGGYGDLCRLTRTRVLVDVIGGSSAGGINGAVLGMALAHGTDASAVRDVWVQRASLDELLRDCTDPDARTSVLRGDGYFLPHLQEVFQALRGSPTDPVRQPVDLILTGTLLDGVRVEQHDDFGSTFTDTTHRAEFRFGRGGTFAADQFAEPDIAGKLAVAARATSSFPGAFEPTFCPVGPGHDVDLSGHVSFPTSTYVIDGGVLVNKPLRPVLDAVIRRRDEPGVRRVIGYIQPAPDQEAAYGAAALPGFTSVLRAGLLTLPHAESLSRELRELHEHNERVARRERGLQSELQVPLEDVVRAAEHLLPRYLVLRGGGRGLSDRFPATAAAMAAWPWTVSEVGHALDVLEALARCADHLGGPDPDLAGLRERLRRADADARATGEDDADGRLDLLHRRIAEQVACRLPAGVRPRPGGEPSVVLACRRFLLASAVVHGVSGSGCRTGTVPIGLLHISAEAPNGLDGRRRPSEKLAGLQLQHFGAFYRSSWRANDWMWGRLDGITRLVQLLLDPRRLHDLATGDPGFPALCYREIRRLAGGDALGAETEAAIQEELRCLTGPADRLPPQLAACILAVAGRLQLRAAAAELPYIATCVEVDRAKGHRVGAGAAALAGQPLAEDPSVRVAFTACRLGEERLADDVGSPAYERFADRVTRLGVLAAHRRRSVTEGTSRARPAGWTSGTVPPVRRALQHAALLSRWPSVIVVVGTAAGAGLILSAVSARVSAVVAVLVGVLLIGVGTAVSALVADRGRSLAIATGVALAACLMLAPLGPWFWRGWLLLACGTDLALSAARTRRLR